MRRTATESAVNRDLVGGDWHDRDEPDEKEEAEDEAVVDAALSSPRFPTDLHNPNGDTIGFFFEEEKGGVEGYLWSNSNS